VVSIATLLAVGCGSDASQTTVTSTSPPTTIAVSSTISRTTQPGFCDGNENWSFKVPDGWYANLQPAGSRRPSCVVLQPRVPASDLRDGFFRLGEDEVDLGGYATVIKGYSESIQIMLGGVAANSGVVTAVNVSATGVRTDLPTPNAVFQLVLGDQNPRNLQIVRYRGVIADDIGNFHRGDVDYGFILTNPAGGTVRIAPSSLTTLTEGEIMPALERLIPTFAFK
jgi:hypothetical protein